MNQTSYNCTQQELYTIARLGWNNCLRYLTHFEEFSTLYNNTLVTTNIAQISTTSEISDFYQRNHETKIHHIHLTKAAKEGCALYKKLKRYIQSTFPPDEQAIMFNSAGQQYFLSAFRNNWDAVQSMLNNAAAFIIANAAILQSNAGMPPNFSTIVTTAKNDFSTLHQSFLKHKENQKISTAQKIKANNQIYAILIAMFLDGQEIFKNQPALLKLFNFDYCLYLVRGSGTAGVRGTVSDSSTSLPIPSATIQLGTNNYSAISDIDGYYQISPAAAATYPVTVSAPGYQPLTIQAHVILTGTISTLNLLLNPVIQPEP